MSTRHHHQSQKDRLIKIGLEGFDLLQKVYPQSRRSAGRATAAPPPPPQGHHQNQYSSYQQNHHHHHRQFHQQSYVYEGPHISTVQQAPAISCTEAAQYYRGKVVCDYSARRPAQ